MTFQELMNHWDNGKYDSNRDTYAQIAAQAKHFNLIPVIGAGLSKWADYPLWAPLLSNHAEAFGVGAQVRAQLAGYHYEDAAETLSAACGAETWYQLLEDSFAPANIPRHRPKRPGYQRFLPHLFPGLVMTTNFDRCLEDLYTDPNSVNPSNLFQAAGAERSRFLGRHLLIKLHGDISQPDALVLTRSAYDRCYGPDPDAPDLQLPLPAYLRQRIQERPMLFLGCSLYQDRTLRVLRSCGQGLRHFALLPMPEGDFSLRRQELRSMGICPIWYPAGAHDEALGVFFEQLARDCGIRIPRFPDTPAYPLVGRDAVVEQLCASLSADPPECRWVTGEPGIGKTEVCREVLRRSGLQIPFVDCTNAHAPLLLYSAVTRDCGIRLPDHAQADPRDHLARILRETCDGVCFDNFEDIWRGCRADERQQLAAWLLELKRSGLWLLFSTQDPLPPELGRGLSLDVLDRGAKDALTIPEAELLTLDSVKLFTYIYGDVPPRELPHLRRLIRQLEGHPLAIVLTAAQARARALGLRSLLDRWDEAVREVYQGNRRHTSLAAALALIWDAVKEDPQALFYWALQYHAVMPIPQEFHSWLLTGPASEPGMDRLRTGSLLRVDREKGTVGMLLPVKMQLPRLMDRWDDLRTPSLLHWAEALTGLLSLADHRSRPESNDAHLLAIRLMPQVCHVLESLAETGETGEAALCDLLWAACNHYKYYPASLSSLQILTGFLSPDTHPSELAFTYRHSGNLMLFLGDPRGAMEALDQAEALYRKVQDDLGLANALQAKGDLMRLLGDPKGAMEALDQAEALYRKVHSDLGLANTLQAKGVLLRLLGDPRGAMEAYDQAENLFRKVHNDLGLANILQAKGVLLRLLGDPRGAMEALAQAENLCRKVQDDLGLANTLHAKGEVMRIQGNAKGAMEALDQAEDLYRKIHSDLGLANTLQAKGDVMRIQGNAKGAMEAYDLAEALYRKVQDDQGLANTLRFRAILLGSQGDYTGALRQCRTAFFLYRKTGDPDGQAYALAIKYLALCCLSRRMEARRMKRLLLAMQDRLSPATQNYIKEVLNE